jgi:hypothetical protein
MGLIAAIDLIVVGTLVAIALSKGLEKALPFFTFNMILFPLESQFHVPALFDITTQRVAILTLAILYLVLANKGGSTTNARPTPLRYLILLIMLWSMVSTVNSLVFAISLKTALSQIFDFFLVYYIVFRTVSSVKSVQRIIFAIVLAMFVCCVLGYIESYHLWSVLDLFPARQVRFASGMVGGLAFDLSRGLRVRATFPHPILFGSALAIAIPLALYALAQAKNARQKVFLWLTIVLMFMNLYKTTSRGPWLAALISLILLAAFSQGRIRSSLLVILFLTITVLIIRPGVRETIKDQYIATVDPETVEGESYEWRYALMRVGREALSKDAGRFLWGYGLESFYYLGLEGDFQGQTVKYESCDSAVVELMVDTGYVGLLLVVALLLKAAWTLISGFMHLPKPANLLPLIFLINLVAYGFMMTNVMIFGWGQQSYMLWIILAMSMAYPRFVRAQRACKNEVIVGSSKMKWELAEVAVR